MTPRDEPETTPAEPTIKEGFMSDTVKTSESLGTVFDPPPEEVPPAPPVDEPPADEPNTPPEQTAPTQEHTPPPPQTPNTTGVTFDGAYHVAWYCDDDGGLHHIGSFNNPDSAEGGIAAYFAANGIEEPPRAGSAVDPDAPETE
jgi:hypothetical protein